jgi:hypothetical protein
MFMQVNVCVRLFLVPVKVTHSPASEMALPLVFVEILLSDFVWLSLSAPSVWPH